MFGTVLIVMLIFYSVKCNMTDLSWSRWWCQVPITDTRRHQVTYDKKLNTECHCPPNKECVLEYKINKDVIDLLHIRGILNDDQKAEYLEDIKHIEEATTESADKYLKDLRRMRRNADNEKPGENCCCPPQSVNMPTFITRRRFKQVIDRIIDFAKKDDSQEG